MIDALQNKIRSSTFQEKQHSINGIPIFKAKDPQSFDDLLEQIDKVAALTNKNHISWHLHNTKDLSVEQLAHFNPLWDGAKLKNNCVIILAQWLLSKMQHLC